MFTLPQPGDVKDTHKTDALPVVEVEEEQKTVDILLRLCYPGHVPVLEDINDIKLLLAAITKYEMAPLMSLAQISLASPKHLEASPLRVYALACLYHLPEEARSAARATLQLQRRKL